MYRTLFLCIGAYLVGSIPFSYLVARWAMGIDIRKHGDGNVGASNVSRVVGKKAGIAAFLCDVVKGVLPVFLALLVFKLPERSAVLAGLCVISGHNWPVFLGFRGGKGMSTTIGVVGTLVPIEAAVLLIPLFFLYKLLGHGIVSIIILGPFLPLICWWKGRSIWIIGGTIVILAFVYLGAVRNVRNAWREVKAKLPESRTKNKEEQ